MAWTATVTLDSDKSDVGTATAIWDFGGPDEFTYSRRSGLSGADATQFKAEAIAARSAAASKRTAEQSLSATLTTIMNS